MAALIRILAGTLGFLLAALSVVVLFGISGLNDTETLSHRRQAVVSLKNEYLRTISVRGDGRRFENYMHLQTLIMGAPSRGPVRLGRFMAAVERRYA